MHIELGLYVCADINAAAAADAVRVPPGVRERIAIPRRCRSGGRQRRRWRRRRVENQFITRPALVSYAANRAGAGAGAGRADAEWGWAVDAVLGSLCLSHRCRPDLWFRWWRGDGDGGDGAGCWCGRPYNKVRCERVFFPCHSFVAWAQAVLPPHATPPALRRTCVSGVYYIRAYVCLFVFGVFDVRRKVLRPSLAARRKRKANGKDACTRERALETQCKVSLIDFALAHGREHVRGGWGGGVAMWDTQSAVNGVNGRRRRRLRGRSGKICVQYSVTCNIL